MERLSNTRLKDLTNSKGQTVLHTACINKCPQIVKALVERYHWDFAQKDNLHYTALHYAVEKGIDSFSGMHLPSHGFCVIYLVATTFL